MSIDTYAARVIQNNSIAAELSEIVLEMPKSALEGATPGQCAHVKVPGGGLLLRRPISIYSVEGGVLRLAIQSKGEGTERIVAAKVGDTLDVLFPFGKGFHVDDAKEVWLVGGGVGVAPMRGCAEGFSGIAKRAYFGYRSAAHGYAAKECRQAGLDVTVCTDDGSAGEHGLVTEPLARDLLERKPDLIMACGPAPMLRAVQSIAKEHGVPLQVSLEQRMGCGIGACLVCSCMASVGGYLRVCADGPVFGAEEVQL